MRSLQNVSRFVFSFYVTEWKKLLASWWLEELYSLKRVHRQWNGWLLQLYFLWYNTTFTCIVSYCPYLYLDHEVIDVIVCVINLHCFHLAVVCFRIFFCRKEIVCQQLFSLILNTHLLWLEQPASYGSKVTEDFRNHSAINHSNKIINF